MTLISFFQLCQYFQTTLKTLKHRNFSKSVPISLIGKKKSRNTRNTTASANTYFRIRKKSSRNLRYFAVLKIMLLDEHLKLVNTEYSSINLKC